VTLKLTTFEKWLVAIAVLLLLAGGLLRLADAQDAAPKPLTAEEKNLVSRAEVTLLRAQQKKLDDQKLDDQAVQKAQMTLNQQIQKVYTERKITADQWTLCEASAPPFCSQAPDGDLSLQPVPKTENKTKETK
jgi:hypothetical protein